MAPASRDLRVPPVIAAPRDRKVRRARRESKESRAPAAAIQDRRVPRGRPVLRDLPEIGRAHV